ncbi:hypothetical protein ALC56_13224 [Trachymyrmex septentrionalis]|uniref:Uncharacterized protein n=1 Tax=Trachymyrmex septentrionalis TaxID=34720 RepID=A0A195EWT9_9HYME|nr:hypothetical protein ALC56_13224 [Trachymyrmex septentrionalis]
MPRAPFTIAELSKETRRASDDRENTTARLFVTIVNSAKGRRERESRGGRHRRQHTRAAESRDERFWGNYRWINLRPMNIETIFVEGKEHFPHSRTGGNEGMDTFVMSTAASIKEKPEVERLPSVM